VGAVVGQLAKMRDCRVVGLAGTAEKCAYIVDELGFDTAIDYRAEEVVAALAAACPDGIDIYFDNVGGVILDAALQHLNYKARVPMCGAVSEYNGELQARPGPSWNRLVQTSEAILTGFRQGQFADRHEEAFAMLAMWVRSGALKYREHIVDGLDNAAAAFIGMLQGRNFGKLLVQAGEDPTRTSLAAGR
jgi:NADPH-dependent curcumin reductase CurA